MNALGGRGIYPINRYLLGGQRLRAGGVAGVELGEKRVFANGGPGTTSASS